MNLPLYIAKIIYYNQDDKKKVSRPAIKIASVGVAIGLAVMIITISVILGFKHTIENKVIGFGNHIQVLNSQTMHGVNHVPITLDDNLLNLIQSFDGVKQTGRFSTAQGILKTESDFKGINFKGIGPEYNTEFLKNNLVSGIIPEFSDSNSNNQILISQHTAEKLQLKTDETILAYFINHSNVRARKFTIKGIYRTDLSYFDDVLCFTDIYTINKLNKWDDNQCSGLEIIVDDFNELSKPNFFFINIINKNLDKAGNTLSSATIKEIYPQIFTWLQLLDLNAWIIIVLMLCVAGFTMISGLLIIILERVQMIGVLKALGANDSIIRSTFLWFATFIIAKGIIWGNIIGISIILIQSATGLIQLDPENYYVSTAPMELNIPIIILLNVATLFVCIMILVMPSFIVSRIQPIKSIRYD